MNRKLLNKEVQDFLEENYSADLSKMALKGSPFEGVSARELAEQLSGKETAKKKLPLWFRTRNVIYPPKINLEQTSSERTAEYKAKLVAGDSLLDLTGGFGIDSYYFARKIKKVIHTELDPELSEIVEHNFKSLNAGNIDTIAGDGLKFLEGYSGKFDWIFIDPSRRSESGGKVFFLSDCLPNVPDNLDLLWAKTDNILIKTSPLLDLKAGLRELPGVSEIHIVAVENEVKELLWVLRKGVSKALEMTTINLRKKEDQIFRANFKEEDSAEAYTAPLKFLYEPNAAIMKSGLFVELGKVYELQKLHPNTQLFSSDELKDFPGRRFHIVQVIPYKKKKIRSSLDTKKANIATRNFPETVASLRKQLKIGDGGDDYLFFTTGPSGEKLVLVCKKI